MAAANLESRTMKRRFDSIGFGMALHGRRQMRGLDLRSAAAQVGISAATFQRVEAGHPCDLQTAICAADWLELPIESFIREHREEPAT